MKSFYFILILLLTGFIATRAFPAQPPCRTADDVFSFAQSLMDDGDYAASVSEFKRFAFFFPKDDRIPEALFNAGTARFKQHRYSDAIALFQSVTEKYGTSDFAIESAFMTSRCLVAADDTDSAVVLLHRLSLSPFDRKVRDRALARIGWLSLQTRDTAAARKAFSAISDNGKKLYHVPAILNELNGVKNKVPRKSPVLAGIYSIVPGGGYLYCGRFRDAAMAFFINTAIAAAAYEGFDKQIYALGGMMGAVGVGFYGGSIYGGISSAHKYNARAQDHFIDGIKQKYEPSDVSLGTLRNGFFVAVSIKF